jgi:hypothetical protein
MCFWYLELIELIQKNGCVEFSIISSPESLYSLVDRFLVSVVEKVCDFTSPVHGLDLDLNCFRFISGDDVIHCAYVASWFDLDHVSRLDLHGGDVIGSWADLIGADGTN